MHPILFSYGSLRIYSYGVLIAAGALFALPFWSKKWKKMGLKSDEDLWLLINILIVSGFVGGRILYLFEDVGIHNPQFWQAAFAFDHGFAYMGTVVAVVMGAFIFCWWKKIEFLRLMDYLCQAAPFCQTFGRLGCFAAGCCYGVPPRRPLPWAVVFTDPKSMVDWRYLGIPIHPTQLYESFGCLIIGIFIYFLALRPVEAGKMPRGMVCVAYFASYAVLRFVIEFYRGDVTMLGLGLTVAQAFCLALLAFSIGLFFMIRNKPCTQS